MMAFWEGVMVGGLVLCCPNIVSHSLLMGFRYPFNIIFPFNVILTISFSKIALHPASHSCAMEMREDDVKWGKMRASLSDSGSSGIGRKASCVFCIILPAGNLTEIRFFEIILFGKLHFTVR